MRARVGSASSALVVRTAMPRSCRGCVSLTSSGVTQGPHVSTHVSGQQGQTPGTAEGLRLRADDNEVEVRHDVYTGVQVSVRSESLHLGIDPPQQAVP